jgi:hypothetical protein
MRIEVLLNTKASRSSEIRPQLDSELQALGQEGVRIATQTRDVKPSELGFAEAFQFIIEHGHSIADAIPLITAVVQLTNSVLKRYGISRGAGRAAKDESAYVVVKIEDHRIALPANDAQVKRYLKNVETGRKPRTKAASVSKKNASSGSRGKAGTRVKK